MKTTHISGPSGCGKSIAMSAICNDLERQGRAVLTAMPGSTTAAVLAMCTAPVPYAIFIPDYDPKLIDLDALNARPELANVWCYVEVETMPNDRLDDILPLTVAGHAHRLANSSAGIVTMASRDGLAPLALVIAADSEGGEYD